MGFSNIRFIFTSVDGIEWKARAMPPGIAERGGLKHIIFGNGVFLAWGNGVPGIVSRNGSDWKLIEAIPPFSEAVFGNGKFYAFTHPVATMPVLYSSVDGLNWEKLSDPTPNYVNSMLFAGNGRLVCLRYANHNGDLSYFLAASPPFLSLEMRDKNSITIYGEPATKYVLESGAIINDSFAVDSSYSSAIQPEGQDTLHITNNSGNFIFRSFQNP